MNPLDQFALRDKVAVVLGGTSGIGQAIARGYAAAGATTIASSRDQAKVNAMGDELEKLGSKTLRLTSDVQDRASLDALCSEVVLAFDFNLIALESDLRMILRVKKICAAQMIVPLLNSGPDSSGINPYFDRGIAWIFRVEFKQSLPGGVPQVCRPDGSQVS